MKYSLLALGAALLVASGCHQYPTNYGDAKTKMNLPEKRFNTLTTHSAPWSEIDRQQWLENYTMEVNFEVGSSQIDPMDVIYIQEFADTLNRLWEPEIYIEGHADSTGPMIFNEGLADRRARAVRDVLVDHGISPNRVNI